MDFEFLKLKKLNKFKKISLFIIFNAQGGREEVVFIIIYIYNIYNDNDICIGRKREFFGNIFIINSTKIRLQWNRL